MKTKRWISLFLILILLLSFAACGKKEAVETEETKENTTTEETQETKGRAVLEKNQLTEMKQFTATTLDGKEFTQEDFKKVDLTLIDVWQTGCGPCIDQFPKLAELQKSLPKNVQIITSCLDGSSNKELAEKILKDAGLDVTTIVSGDGDWEREDKKIAFTPTYLLVDSEGKVLGEVSGARTADDFKALLNETLKKLGKETF